MASAGSPPLVMASAGSPAAAVPWRLPLVCLAREVPQIQRVVAAPSAPLSQATAKSISKAGSVSPQVFVAQPSPRKTLSFNYSNQGPSETGLDCKAHHLPLGIAQVLALADRRMYVKSISSARLGFASWSNLLACSASLTEINTETPYFTHRLVLSHLIKMCIKKCF